MEWYDKVKRFLGFPAPQESPSYSEPDRHLPVPPEPPHRNEEFDSVFRSPSQSFSMFTDPLEMHKYFEQQMSEMLRSFGFTEFGDSFSHHFENFGGHFGSGFGDYGSGFPQIQEIPDEDDVPQGNLREQFLKPGYERETQVPQERRDADLDGKLDIRDWGSVFKGQNSVTPYERQVAPKTRFYGQSMSTKTVINPDGSIETHRTVRDNEGNEETTITRKIGDKEHTVTKRRTKDGKEEVVEDLVNLDEKEVDKFFPKQQKPPELDQQPWPFFDRFFK